MKQPGIVMVMTQADENGWRMLHSYQSGKTSGVVKTVTDVRDIKGGCLVRVRHYKGEDGNALALVSERVERHEGESFQSLADKQGVHITEKRTTYIYGRLPNSAVEKS